jgi:hypothetical protein
MVGAVMIWKVVAIYSTGALVWGAILEYGVSAQTIAGLKAAPPGGMTGEMLLWPWGVGSFVYTLATS